MRDPASIAATPVPEVSVLIPVEFHRGQAVACIRRWAQAQDCAAERYELIVSAPDTLDAQTEAEIRQVLRPRDRFLQSVEHHDMSLVAAAARASASELLIFTESHCLPEPHAVSTLLGIAAERPAWAGFSCPTTPLVHNLLSRVEADVYASHIQRELESTGWLKVVDQCFVVRRDAYFAAGGFRAEFGHFAEWLLAAEMHRRGLVVGMHPTSVLQHYYVGDFEELAAFTLDFAHGQIKYLAERMDEPVSAYFPALPELDTFRQRNRNDHRRMFVLWMRVLRALLQQRPSRQDVSPDPPPQLRRYLRECLQAATRAWLPWLAEPLAARRARRARMQLEDAIARQDPDGAKVAFVAWFGKLVIQAREAYLRHHPALRNASVRGGRVGDSGVWAPLHVSTESDPPEFLGFHEVEGTAEAGLRWSEPAASVWLPLAAGRSRLVVEWHAVRALGSDDLLWIGLDGVRAGAPALTCGPHGLILEADVASQGWHRLDWAVRPFPAPRDDRLLGLPVTAIRWTRA